MSEMDDRELDAAIASRVRGLHIGIENGHAYILSPSANPADWEIPAYSTDISAAMEVLERFNDGPWSIVRSDHPSAEGAPYEVSLSRHRGRHSSRLKTYQASALTLPRAICLAALAAAESKQ